ncbi:eukaryotic translation elongation factor 1 epsilon-1 [Anoplophora glabripennis]|uniref:eukaryotic translation elongation factor 1 epsilon-1 n=1 Tax=Anoplophora glabripennis TaxID=217634 RepID=UPI0008754AB4|nr:eukaryotic translation elongation factor 1 epsilon-1 [Anoplophora glabripennis]
MQIQKKQAFKLKTVIYGSTRSIFFVYRGSGVLLFACTLCVYIISIMVLNPQQYLEQLASHLKVPLGKIQINEDSICSRTIGNKTVTGVTNIVLSMLIESNSNLWSKDSLEKAEIQQWLEYGIVHVIHIDEPQNLRQILSDLNDMLATKTYLVSYKLTVADVMLYYILINAMVAMSYLDKQKYMNLSRWFDNLQQDACIRQSNKLVDFSTNYLASLAPSKH